MKNITLPHWLPSFLSFIAAPYEFDQLQQFSLTKDLPKEADQIQRQLDRAQTQLKLGQMDSGNADFIRQKFESGPAIRRSEK